MTERWTDKKTGFTGSVPANLGNLSMKRFLQEQGGVFVTKKTMREDDGSEAIMKSHGMYAKVIHEPVLEEVTPFFISCTTPEVPPDFLIFYRDGETTMMAYLEFDDNGVPILNESRTVASLGIENFTDKVFCHSKRFMHNVQMLSGEIVNRELYLVAMSFQLTPLGSYSGWANFVTNNPDFALVTNTEEIPIESTAKLIADLNRVNRSVNRNHSYAPDGLLDNWNILGFEEAGDCEDFALTKAELLLEMGYPASAIRLVTGKTESGLGHAWLVVQTTGGDYALDINYSDIQCDESLPYTHRQRQTGIIWKVTSLFDSFRDAVHAGYDFDRNQPKVWWYIYDPLVNKFSEIFGSAQTLPYAPDTSKDNWGDVVIALEHADTAITHNACNFSEDNNYIYVSTFNGSQKIGYVLRYEEQSVGIFGQTQIFGETYPGNGVWCILKDGSIWVTTASLYHPRRHNMHTGAVVETWTHYNGVQISSKDGYYDFNLYNYTESGWTQTQETLPINGSWTSTLVTGTPPPDPPDWEATMYGTVYENVRGLFPADFAESPFYVTNSFFYLSHKLGEFTGIYSWGNAKTLNIPGQSPIDLGSIGRESPDFYPEQPVKRALPLCFVHGETEKIWGLLVTNPMVMGDAMTEYTKMLFRNDVRFDAALAAAAGVYVENILGLVYAPKKEAA